MRRVTSVVLLLAFLPLYGCDGHSERLYLKSAHSGKPPWYVSSRVIIEIDGGEDVIGVISSVAAELGMMPDPERQNAWVIHGTYPNQFFWMLVSKSDSGYWEVALLDFPTLSRSQNSLKAEQAIRERFNRAKS